MKKLLLIYSIILITITSCFVVSAENQVPQTTGVIMMINNKTAYVNSEKVEIDVAPVIKNDRTFVPLRFCAEALNAEVIWIDETQSVVVRKADKIVEFYLNNKVYKVNGKLFEADVEPFLENGRTMLPIRFLAEAVNEKVEWFESGIITISVGDYSEAGRKYWETLFIK